MAKSKSTSTSGARILKAVAEVQVQAWREGSRRAISMLRDLDSYPAALLEGNEVNRADGGPQQTVVAGHLLGVMGTRDLSVMLAFSAVLTHYIGVCMNGGAPDVDCVAREMRKPIHTEMTGARAKIPTKPFSEVAHA